MVPASIVDWCDRNGVKQLILFESPSDEERIQIVNNLVWLNVGRRNKHLPELVIYYPGGEIPNSNG